MNLEEANEIVYRYNLLLESIPKEKITPPNPSFGMSRAFNLDALVIEDGQIKATWSRYVGCNEYDYDTTYHPLSEFFKDEA